MTRPAASSPVPGFLLERGRYTPVAIPRRLAATAPWGIYPTGINDRRQIVGEYVDDRLISRGFLRDKHGRFATFAASGVPLTFPFGLNDRGQIVGFGFDPAT